MRGRTFGTILALGLVLALTVGLVGSAQLVGQNPDFDSVAAEEEAYWYSRYNLGHLTMRSGMGETFMPDAAMVEMMIQAADADPDDGDTATPATNAALLQTVYAEGDPHWTQEPNPMDFATLRWDEATFDKAVTGSAIGWTIIKELEWAKQFHVDAHFGQPTDPFGAQWRFVGIVMVAMPKMQAQSWMALHEQGTVQMVDKSDPYVMLAALSDLAQVLEAETLPHSASNRYRDPEGEALFLAEADKQFDRVKGMPSEEMNTKELALAIQGLAWFAAVTHDPDRQDQALQLVADLGKELIMAKKATATQKGYVIRGLIEAYRLTNSTMYQLPAVQAFDSLAAEYDSTHGVFTSQSTYTIDDVAAIIGGLNAIKLFGGVDESEVEKIFAGFFESAVNLSGLQQAVPPKEASKGDFELDEPDIFYGYPTLPLPREAGGEFGIAPVFATSVTFDSETENWTAIDRRFDTAGAMHAANEFIWLHHDEVNGFPEVVLAARPTEPVTEVATEIKTPIVLWLFAGLAILGVVVYLILKP